PNIIQAAKQTVKAQVLIASTTRPRLFVMTTPGYSGNQRSRPGYGCMFGADAARPEEGCATHSDTLASVRQLCGRPAHGQPIARTAHAHARIQLTPRRELDGSAIP